MDDAPKVKDFVYADPAKEEKDRVIRKDGGPAFPQQEFQKIGDVAEGKSVGGMSLRDYFAAAALQGALAGRNAAIKTAIENAGEVSKQCFLLADAMLKEREK